jgi:hypothetical protein
VYAEAGKDFVDVLFSFLTLPMGTVARLVDKTSNIGPVSFGSISSLHQSVIHLDEELLCSNICRYMLLSPRNSMESYCQQLKVKIDDTLIQYSVCEDWDDRCIYSQESTVSAFWNKKCHCGKVLNVVPRSNLISVENGFVKETATFIIQDNLSLIPNDPGKILRLLQMNGIDDIADIESKTLHIRKYGVCFLRHFFNSILSSFSFFW